MACKRCQSIRRWFLTKIGVIAVFEQTVDMIAADRQQIFTTQQMLDVTNVSLATLEKRTMKADQTLVAAIDKAVTDIEDRLVVIRETISATREDLRKVSGDGGETDAELGLLAERVSLLENPDFKAIEYKLDELKDG